MISKVVQLQQVMTKIFLEQVQRIIIINFKNGLCNRARQLQHLAGKTNEAKLSLRRERKQYTSIFEKIACTRWNLNKQKGSNGYELMLTAKIDKNSELLYSFWDQEANKVSSRVTVFQKNIYLRARSSEIRKNISKKIALINSISQKSQVYLMVNQVSNQFQFLSSIYQSNNQSKEKKYTNLKNMISQCLFFSQKLHQSHSLQIKPYKQISLLTECSESMRSHLISKVGQFSFLNGIRQQMSCTNINISSTLKETKQCKIEKSFHENISKIIKIYNNRTYPHDIKLFTQANDFIKQRKITKESESFTEGMLSYKPPPCINFDNNLIFTTIFNQQQDKIKQNLKCIATSIKTQLYYFKGKIKYGYSSPLNDKYNSSEEEVIAQTKTAENYLSPYASKSIQKGILMKTFNKSLSPQQKKKVEYMINYEKAVVRNFRGAQCIYLPKYYQHVQKYSQFRDCLLIDFMPGSNLEDVIIKRSQFLTFSWKLHLLMHLSNALRFLQYYDIAHLDLSVNNIILTLEGISKIIDFREVYHEQTIRRQKNFRITAKSNDPIFKPGRTFPFASSEMSQRTWNFNIKQDMFSLRMIGFILVLGYLPHNCSQTKIEQLYRPNSSFVHLIFKKMFDLVQNIL